MVYFTRHGESEANIEKVFSNKGFKHPLTSKGINQALDLADQLKGRHINKILSSPILRAIQTASIVSEQLHIESFEIHNYLREYDVGDLEGKSDTNSWNAYFENEQSWRDINKHHYRLPNGESFVDIQNRFASFITQEITEKPYTNTNVLIVTHGGLLKNGLTAVCLNIDYEFTCNNPISNCEIIGCEIIDRKLKCIAWGNKILN